MNGQGLVPQGYHPLVDLRSEQEIGGFLGDIENVIQKCVDVMPTHEETIARYCSAGGAR